MAQGDRTMLCRIIAKGAEFRQVRQDAVNVARQAMGPGFSNVMAVSVFTPGMPQQNSSRVLRVPVRRLSAVMSSLHQHGAVVTHVGLSAGQASPSEAGDSEHPAAKASGKRRGSRKEKEGHS